MKTDELIDLVLKSSDENPYSGKLSKKDNLIAAIDLAKLFLNFADKGMEFEAMFVKSDQWNEVIEKLEEIQLTENRRNRSN